MMHREVRGGDWLDDDLIAGKNDNYRNALIEKPLSKLSKTLPIFPAGCCLNTTSIAFRENENS